jgi:hypothetical protein
MSVHPTIKFAPRKQADFYATLTARVNDYFKQHKKEKTGDIRLYVKSVILLASYILPFALLLAFDFSITWNGRHWVQYYARCQPRRLLQIATGQ